MNKNIESVTAAIEYIENHLPEKLDLEIVANAVHYSKYHLHRMFANTVGLTIHDYIQRRQLTEAARLLVFSDKPILEIAITCGYNSQQSFTAIFKAMYKKAPNQYREHKEFYPLQLKYILNKNPIELENIIDLQKNIIFAKSDDISKWMELVYIVIDGFPYLNEEKYIKQLGEYIAHNKAFILKDTDTAIGVMLFNNETGSIDFLGIHPQYNKRKIAKAFLHRAINELTNISKDITITTFRQGDKADIGYRETFKSIGFVEAEMLVEFGYPTQRLVLKKESLGDINYE